MNNLLTETSIKNLNSVKSYQKYISQFEKGNPNKIKLGTLWAFNYDYYTFYDFEILKYFDRKPLSLFISHWKEKNLWGAINLHFSPVLLRAQFINRLKSRNPIQFKNDGVNPIKVNYQVIKQTFFKFKYMFRWYRPEAISQSYVIPNKEWINASQYQVSSFHKVDINQIVKRYKSWPSQENDSFKQNIKESLNFDFESIQSFDPKIINTLNDYEINPNPIF